MSSWVEAVAATLTVSVCCSLCRNLAKSSKVRFFPRFAAAEIIFTSQDAGIEFRRFQEATVGYFSPSASAIAFNDGHILNTHSII